MVLHPLIVFALAWVVSIGCYALRISHWMPDRIGLLWAVFGFSAVLFLLGYLFGNSCRPSGPRLRPDDGFHVNLPRLRRFQLALAIVSVAIIVYNLATAGLPPCVRRSGVETSYYLQ